VDFCAEHILLLICDLIQLVPLPSAKLSRHFKLILLPPAHQRGDGSRILSRIMFNISDISRLISNICNMNAFFSFDLFLVYIPECKQQLRTMKYYTQIQDIAHFKSGL
jgi:hypothetical protein